jgi:ABC-type branched-subunit amino acid transport system substrate-binding protein
MTRAALSLGLTLFFVVGAGWAAEPIDPVCSGGDPNLEPVVIGLLPGRDAAVTERIAAGICQVIEGLEAGAYHVELRVGAAAGTWSGTPGAAVELVHELGAAALVTAPDREVAHVASQIGTRAHLPVVSTSGASSVTASGSWWVVSVAPASDESDLSPSQLGHDAAATLLTAIRAGAGSSEEIAAALETRPTVDGATDRFTFDDRGRRIPAPR